MTESIRLVTPTLNDLPEETCAQCGKGGLVTHWRDESFPYGTGDSAVNLTARIPVRECQACGFEFTDDEADSLMHEAVCRHLGVQTPVEVLAIRKKYNMSRPEFAQLTKLGEATLGRWERGALIQNAANDQFLYLLRFADNVDRLRARRPGVDVVEETKPAIQTTLRIVVVTPEIRQQAAGFVVRKRA